MKYFLTLIIILSSLQASTESGGKVEIKFMTARVTSDRASVYLNPGYTYKDCAALLSVSSESQLETAIATAALEGRIADSKRLRRLSNNGKLQEAKLNCDDKRRIFLKEGDQVFISVQQVDNRIKKVDGQPQPEYSELNTGGGDEDFTGYYPVSFTHNGKSANGWIEAERVTKPETPDIYRDTKRNASADRFRKAAQRKLQQPLTPPPTPAPPPPPPPPPAPKPPVVKPPTPAPTPPPITPTPPPSTDTSTAPVKTEPADQEPVSLAGENLQPLKDEAELEQYACVYSRKKTPAQIQRFLKAAKAAEEVFGFPRAMYFCKVLLESSMSFNPNEEGAYVGYAQFGPQAVNDLADWVTSATEERGDQYDSEMAQKYQAFQKKFPNQPLKLSTQNVRRSDNPEASIMAIGLFYQFIFNRQRRSEGKLCSGCTTENEGQITRKDSYLMHYGFNYRPYGTSRLHKMSLTQMQADTSTPNQTLNYYQSMDSCMAKGNFKNFRPPYDDSSQEYKDKSASCGLTAQSDQRPAGRVQSSPPQKGAK